MKEINIRRFLVDNKICAAGGEARFLILNNGVKINPIKEGFAINISTNN